MTAPEVEYWRKCTTCKKPIGYKQKYWICSVSTCNRVRTDLVFCDLRCFDAHVPVMNHRDAGAFEKTAPGKGDVEREASSLQKSSSSVSGSLAGPRATQKNPETVDLANELPGSLEDEILVVVSKVKQYIRDRSSMNTSDDVMRILSNRVRALADRGIGSAIQNGRKTVLDRDIR